MNTKYAGGEEITWTGVAAFSSNGVFLLYLKLRHGDTTAISSHISYALQTCLQGLMIPQLSFSSLLSRLAMLQCHLPTMGGCQMLRTIGNSSCRLDSNAVMPLSGTEPNSADMPICNLGSLLVSPSHMSVHRTRRWRLWGLMWGQRLATVPASAPAY